MPAEHSVDPTWLDVVATQLTRSSSAALDASRELLAHYADTGDATTQRAVEALVDTAAQALGAISDALAETSRELLAAVSPDRGSGGHDYQRDSTRGEDGQRDSHRGDDSQRDSHRGDDSHRSGRRP